MHNDIFDANFSLRRIEAAVRAQADLPGRDGIQRLKSKRASSAACI